jgi:3-hydroxy-3-methylglutaryl CoA synthase
MIDIHMSGRLDYAHMPRHTTLRLADALMKRAKTRARETGTTLTAVMEAALAAYLAEPMPTPGKSRVLLPSYGSGGPRAGVNLDSTAALLAVMEEGE